MKINGNAGGSAWIIPPFIHSLRWLVDWLHWQINFLAAGRHWTQCGAAFWPKAETSFRNWLGGCWSAKWGEVDREHLSKLDDGRCNFSFSNASIWRIDVGVFSFFFFCYLFARTENWVWHLVNFSPIWYIFHSVWGQPNLIMTAGRHLVKLIASLSPIAQGSKQL